LRCRRHLKDAPFRDILTCRTLFVYLEIGAFQHVYLFLVLYPARSVRLYFCWKTAVVSVISRLRCGVLHLCVPFVEVSEHSRFHRKRPNRTESRLTRQVLTRTGRTRYYNGTVGSGTKRNRKRPNWTSGCAL
jgi:hypothetical protein